LRAKSSSATRPASALRDAPGPLAAAVVDTRNTPPEMRGPLARTRTVEAAAPPSGVRSVARHAQRSSASPYRARGEPRHHHRDGESGEHHHEQVRDDLD
jgi:hypothetical protein